MGLESELREKMDVLYELVPSLKEPDRDDRSLQRLLRRAQDRDLPNHMVHEAVHEVRTRYRASVATYSA